MEEKKKKHFSTLTGRSPSPRRKCANNGKRSLLLGNSKAKKQKTSHEQNLRNQQPKRNYLNEIPQTPWIQPPIIKFERHEAKVQIRAFGEKTVEVSRGQPKKRVPYLYFINIPQSQWETLKEKKIGKWRKHVPAGKLTIKLRNGAVLSSSIKPNSEIPQLDGTPKDPRINWKKSEGTQKVKFLNAEVLA